MRLRDREPELTAEQERELEAIDRALAGESVDADLAELATLAADLRAERPDPTEEWRDLMDERASAGFRRRQIASAARLWIERLRELRPARVLVPAGAAATLLVAVTVGVATQATDRDDALLDGRDGAGVEGLAERGGGGPADAERSAGPVGQRDLDELELFSGEGASEDGDDLATEEIDPASESPERGRQLFQRDADEGIAAPAPIPAPGGGTAPGVDNRRVERSGYLELSAKPDDVRSVTNRAVEIARGSGGIVLSSQLSEQDGVNSSTLQLQLPTRNLDSVLDQLTGLADVKTLNESALDITKPFISARDRLQDARARRRALLEAIANADNEATIADLEQRLRRARRQISRAEARFEDIARRARMSNLSVAVVGDPNADSGSSWSETFGDAGDVLMRVAAIMLTTAAIVVPIALVAGLLLLAIAGYRRWRRERALES
jgi:hypothetical protein